MKKLKKMLISLLMVAVVSILFGTVSMAASSSTVATIGSKKYTSLSDAFAAAGNKDTIVLQKDVSYSKVLSFSRSGKTVYLDLNGSTITFKKNAYLNVKNGTLVIKNGTIKKSGAYYDEEEGKVVSTILVTGTSGTLKITGGSYKGEIINNGKTTINGGIFTSMTALVYEGAYGFGNVITNKGTMTIKKGTFKATTSKNVFGFYGTLIENKGTLKISGGSFTSKAGQHLHNSGKLTVTGGTFSASGNIVSSLSGVIVNDGGNVVLKSGTYTTSDGSAIVLDWLGTVTISGGTYTHTRQWGDGIATNGGTITIKGGNFTTVNHMIASYPYEETNGSWHYGSITITNGTFTVTGEKTIMLYAYGGAKITVTGGTFIGSSAYKYAKIKDEYTGKTGKVTISGGTFKVKYGKYTG